MGEKSDAKLMYSIDGKSFHEIKEVSEVTLVDNDSGEELFHVFEPQSLTFECRTPSIELLKTIYGEFMTIRYCQSTKSNNWLRRHGLPMRRRDRR